MNRVIAMENEAISQKRAESEDAQAVPWQVESTPSGRVTVTPHEHERMDVSGLIYLQGLASRYQQERAELELAEEAANHQMTYKVMPMVPAAVTPEPERRTWTAWLWASAAMVVIAGCLGVFAWKLWPESLPQPFVPGGLHVAHGSPAAALKGLTTDEPKSPVQGVASQEPEPELPSAVVTLGGDESKRRRKRRRAVDVEGVDKQAQAAKAPVSLSTVLGTMAATSRPPAPAPAAETQPKPMDTPAKPPARASALELLRAATGTGSEATKAQPDASKPDLPRRLTNRQIIKRVWSVRAQARACIKRYGFTFQTLTVKLALEGPTGRVISANVVGRTRGTPVARCVERVVRGTRFPRSAAPRQTITVPLVVR